MSHPRALMKTGIETFRRLSLALVALCGVGLAACGSSPTPNTVDAGDTDTDTGGGDVADVSDTDTSEVSCVPGTEDCACDEGSCGEDLLCDEDADLCVPCPFGSEDCRCVPPEGPEDEASCDEGLTCTEDEICVCVPGTEECPCADGDVCDDGLDCVAGLCATPGCEPGVTGCPCDGGACDASDAYCSDRGVCETCNADAVGCACETTCRNGLVCDAGACRTPVPCSAAGCAENQVCDEGAGRDAVCLEDCVAPFVWNAGTGTCDSPPNCDACTAASRECSLATGEPVCGDCLETHIENPDTEECVDVVTCVDLDCESTGDLCTPAEWTGSGGVNAECTDNPCEAGYLLSRGACVECTQCYDFVGGVATAKDGVVGNELDAFSAGGVTAACVCRFDDTAPGRFQNVETGQILLCDSDGDGWTNARFMDVVNLSLPEDENRFLTNATCDLRTVDRFELMSDDAPGEPYEVTVDAIADAYGLAPSQYETDDFGVKFMYLVEPEETDRDDLFEFRYQPAATNRLTRYNGGRLFAAEVNPLVKACNLTRDVNDDLNLDQIVDVLQTHDVPYASTLSRPTAVFYHMAHFIELSRGYYHAVADSAGGHGAYAIVEKSRSGAGSAGLALELTYPEASGPYWAECMRSRDAAYNPSGSWSAATPATELPLNQDFARWRVCEDTSSDTGATGLCRVDDSSAESPRRGRGAYIPYDGRTPITAAARYDEASDGVWPGMNHHSQFKCVTLATATQIGDNAAGYVSVDQLTRLDGDTLTEGDWTLVECRLAESDAGPRTAGSDGPVAGAPEANPRDPQFECTPVLSAFDIGAAANASESSFARHWVVANYRHYAPDADETEYTLGCVNEAIEWPFLCNGYDPNPFYSTAVPSGTIGNFGRLVCGCSVNSGGPECDIGCPTRNVHYGGTWSDDASGSFACTNGYCLTHAPDEDAGFAGGRRGFWMCGDFSATAFTDTSVPPDFRSPDFEDDGETVSGWRLQGEIPSSPFHRVRLTQDGVPEGSGWSIY